MYILTSKISEYMYVEIEQCDIVIGSLGNNIQNSFQLWPAYAAREY